MLRYLVTGAGGFVGSHMIELLKKGNNNIIRATDLKDSKLTFSLAENIEIRSSDLTKPETLKGIAKDIDYVLNIASLFSYTAPYDLMYKVNVEGAKNLCEELIKSNVKKIIHWSTCDVYGSPKKLPTTEEHPKNPENSYQKTKWEQEQLFMKYYKENGLPVIAIRPAPIYGPGNTYGFGSTIFLLARGQIMGIPGNGKMRIPFVHVRDVCKSALHLIEHGKVGEAYNVVDDSTYTVEELLKWAAPYLYTRIFNVHMSPKIIIKIAELCTNLAKKANKKSPIELDSAKYLENDYWFSNEKLKGTGFTFEYPDPKKGLIETIEWYKKMGLIEKPLGYK